MNRKQRNLKYIRTKNSIRNGGVITTYYKTNFCATPEQQVGILDSVVNHEEKKYKMCLKVKDIIFGSSNDLFMSDIVTAKIFLQKK